jgi:hypothetical protein
MLCNAVLDLPHGARLRSQQRWRYLGAKIPVRESAEQTEITPRNVHRHLQRLREIKERLQADGVVGLYLFYKGPSLPVGSLRRSIT